MLSVTSQPQHGSGTQNRTAISNLPSSCPAIERCRQTGSGWRICIALFGLRNRCVAFYAYPATNWKPRRDSHPVRAGLQPAASTTSASRLLKLVSKGGICTHTVSFTGRSAADYTTSPHKLGPTTGNAPAWARLQNACITFLPRRQHWCPRGDLHPEPLPSQGSVQILLHLEDDQLVAGTESHRALPCFRRALSCVSYPAIELVLPHGNAP